MQRTPASTLAGIFCLGVSITLFQIALARVVAILVQDRFSGPVITIGLLGFGAAGCLLAVTRFGEPPGAAQRALVWVSCLYGIAVVSALRLLIALPVDGLTSPVGPPDWLVLARIGAIVSVPFLLGGLGLGLALTRNVRHVNGRLGSGLIGGAVGAALSVPAMQCCGSAAAVAFAGAVGLLAAFCFSLGAPRRSLLLSVPGLLAAGWLGIAFAGGSALLRVPALAWEVPFAPGKAAAVVEAQLAAAAANGRLGGQSPALVRIPSATAEVEVGPTVPSLPTLGGDLGRGHRTPMEARFVGEDGDARTVLYRRAAELERFPFLLDTQAASAYVVHAAAGRERPRVLVVGVGGGGDVMVALAHGASHVTAVESNTAVIDMITDRYADYLGGLFAPSSPFASRIELVHDEGRAWLRAQDRCYDCIQVGGAGSPVARDLGAGASWASRLHTVEAVQDCYSRLTADGIASWSLGIEGMPHPCRATLCLANTAVAALRELGIADAATHVCVLQGRDWASTLVKRSPFAPVEIQALRDFATHHGFVGLLHDPLAPLTEPPAPEPSNFTLLRAQWQVAAAALPGVDGDPAKLEIAIDGLQILAAHMAMGELVSAAMLPELLRTPAGSTAALALLEDTRPAITRMASSLAATKAEFRRVLRGGDAERARQIAEPPFALAPATDDRPFVPACGGGPWTNGAQLRIGSVVLILLAAAAMIVASLRRLAHAGVRTTGAWRWCSCFAAIGLGFLLVQVVLVQKLTSFLGNAPCALSVVLASLLAATGAGSLLAGRIVVVRPGHLRTCFIAILVTVLVTAAAVEVVLPMLGGARLAMRVLVAVLLLIPTGLASGVPFPSALRMVQAQCPPLLPWVWAIHSFASVLGASLGSELGTTTGFSSVFCVALVVYALGLSTMKTKPEPGVAETVVGGS